MLPGNGYLDHRMRAAICPLRFEPANSQYATLWSSAARAGWGIAGVFFDDCGSGDSPGIDELRQMIARSDINRGYTSWCTDPTHSALARIMHRSWRV